MVIIATSDKKGWCYIETKNLDGETNKKIRKAEKKEMFRRTGYQEGKVIYIRSDCIINFNEGLEQRGFGMVS